MVWKQNFLDVPQNLKITEKFLEVLIVPNILESNIKYESN